MASDKAEISHQIKQQHLSLWYSALREWRRSVLPV